jgi:hypothetical protein
MHVSYRPVVESELGDAADVFLTSLFDMARRNGLPAPTSYTRAGIEPVYAHILRTGIFRVAEAEGRIVSICNAIVRDGIWFLSMFWTLPDLQQKKVGGPLLQQVFDEGRRQGATCAFTWSSVDFAAMATYMRLGMLPGCQLFTFGGKLTAPPAAVPGYELEALESAAVSLLDARVRGATRQVDHAFWQARGATSHQVRCAGEVVGYFYAQGGVIGPAAWSEPRHGDAVLALAVREAGQQAAEVKLMTPGKNHVAIAAALALGLRLLGSAHLLLTDEFGLMDRYLPSGPALF